MMKKSSVNTAPKGKTPPTSDVNIGWINQGCAGICRGTWFVRTGSSMASFLKPKYEPRKTRGTEMPNHRTSNANIVVKGTAPEDFCPQMSKFKTKKITKTMPGYRKAVRSVHIFQSSPLKTLYNRAEVYPAKTPMNVKRSIMDCNKPPLCAGDRKPKSAKIRVTTDMPKICTPEPTETARSLPNLGLRKTSPCTSFQPVSSAASSAVANSLYLVMSR
mmetsp:Transcript_98799/g.211724  ORF Transcript_98799/g.211724 Transcript_98799/m.211724 type:complete len:217 (-) Transcript_98799:927-1577(-)